MMPTPQRQQGLDESAMALATLNRLSYLRGQAAHRELTEAEQDELAEQPSCLHCGGHHVRACPRVKRIVFRQGGAGVQEVEYWPASEIDWTGVVFEDVGGDPETDEVPIDDIEYLVRIVMTNRSPGKYTEDVTVARRVTAWLESSQAEAVQSVHGQAAG